MEKELNESKTDTPEDRRENAEESAPLPQESSANPPEKKDAEEELPPAQQQEPSEEEPSPLEGRVADLEQQLEQADAQRREGEEKLSATQNSLAEAVSRYRAMLLESMPEAPESMVHGETADEIDRSFAEAQALVHRVRREVEEKLANERLPAGSPTRSPQDFSSLTSMEKIRSALSG